MSDIRANIRLSVDASAFEEALCRQWDAMEQVRATSQQPAHNDATEARP